jgi:tetratricopeptide (TPR) repeat protein
MGLDATINQYKTAVKSRPQDPQLRASLGVLLMMGGYQREGSRALQVASNLGSKEGVVYHFLGTVRLNANDPDGAADAFSMQTKATPGNPRAHYNLGVAHQMAGESAWAVQALEKAAALDKGFLEAHFELARMRHERGEMPQAEAAIARCLEIAPRHFPSTMERGRMQLSLGQFDLAEATFSSAAEIEPEEAGPYIGIGSARLGKPAGEEGKESALKALQKATELNPSSGDAFFLLAEAHRRLGQPDQALKALRAADLLKPKTPNIRYALAQALRSRGEAPEAERILKDLKPESYSREGLFLKRAVDFNPNDIVARRKLAAFLEARGEQLAAQRQHKMIQKLRKAEVVRTQKTLKP